MIGDGSSMGVGGTVNRNIGVGTMSGNDGGGPSAGGSFADDTTRNYWDNYLRDQWKSGEP
jgi:hypothetical protein